MRYDILESAAISTASRPESHEVGNRVQDVECRSRDGLIGMRNGTFDSATVSGSRDDGKCGGLIGIQNGILDSAEAQSSDKD